MIFTNQALALFPPSLGQAIAQTQRDRDELVEEICCRIGRPPVLLTQENVYPAACRAVLPDDLDYLLERATRASVYAAADQIRQGYLQTASGCRVGLCGCAYGQTAGQIDGIRQLSSVSVRIPHAVPGCADALVPQLMKDGFCSTLILSPPGGGKTTLLRECVRRLSDQGLRISLMDERGEIAAVIDSLQLLRSDIVGRLLPLPEALRHTAETVPEPLRGQYTALADGITDSDRPFCEQWAAAIRALDMLTPDARAALLTLGAQLGKYDAQLQRQALDTCIASLRSISAALQDDARRRGKLVCGLGATLGLLAAIALF